MPTSEHTKFRISPFENKTLSWWKTRRSKIDMDPSYQRRGRLWSKTDKAYLIDSILNGYDIPKLYMADFTWGDSTLNIKKLPYAIIDGKQRLEAIFDFVDGAIVLGDDFVYQANPALKLSGLGYQDLKINYPDVAEEFDNYNLLVMSVYARTPAPIQELFVRLNRSKPLTGAEIRNAMAGPAPELIRYIAKHEFIADFISFTTARGQDLNASAKLLLFEYHSKPIATKKSNLDEFAKQTVTQSKDRLELAGRRVIDIFDQLTEIFLPKDKLLGSAGVLPVYYWFIRNENEKNYHRIREFLVSFEYLRLKNRQLIAEDPTSPQIESELTQYDTYNRSTNDQTSHEGRYKILRARFAKFVAQRNLNISLSKTNVRPAKLM